MKANVNGKKEWELLQEGSSFKVDGIKSDVEWEWLGDRRVLLREGSSQFEVELVHADIETKTVIVGIRGNQYEVQLKEEFDLLLEKMGMGPGSTSVQSKIKAPMPGLVLDVLVEPGQSVGVDEPLLILEAMKMENVIKSPREGEIKSIGVAKGNAIEKNTLLIEFQN